MDNERRLEELERRRGTRLLAAGVPKATLGSTRSLDGTVVKMRNVAITCRSAVLTVVVAMYLSACGSGSGQSSAAVGSPSPSPPSTPAPTPPLPSANRSPVLVKSAADQRLVTGHAFTFDVSQQGTSVIDPDGDPLTYQMKATYGTSGGMLPDGLTQSGPVISGVPTTIGNWEIEVQVDDNRGGNSVFLRFYLRVMANAAPAVVNGNTPKLVQAGTYVDYDASQNSTTFRDPDGDALVYAVTLRGNPQGLTASGTHVSGTLDTVGAVEITITASDAYGGVTGNSFLVAAPAPEPTATPSLPASSFVYRDEELSLPYVFRMSSESQSPLWDTQPADNRTTNAGATLGRVLFYDTRLSVTNTVACATCHEQSHGFATARRFDSGVLGIPLKRNSMALANARYSINRSWFGDMRVNGDLRDLIFVPIDNHDELGMSLYSVEAKLKSTPFYPPLFAVAFGTPEISRDRIAAALAQFVQSMISYRSRADLALNPMANEPSNPAAVFNAQEMQGLQIYKDRCVLCHEVSASSNVWQANNGLDAIPTDPGTRIPALQRDGSQGVFRAASLRNVALSGPYMHDGRFTKLREVIDHYDHGVQASPHLDFSLRDVFGAPRRLNLSEYEKNALEAFLNTLTDNAFLNDPKFSDPFPP